MPTSVPRHRGSRARPVSAFTLNADLRTRLRALSESTGLPQSFFVEAALLDHVARHEQQLARAGRRAA